MTTRLAVNQPLGSFEGIGGYLPSGGNFCLVDNLLSNIVGLLTVIGGLTFLVYFIIGGLTWISAGGKQDKVDKAKQYMTNAAVGLIAIVAAYAIASITGTVLGIEVLAPCQEIQKATP